MLPPTPLPPPQRPRISNIFMYIYFWSDYEQLWFLPSPPIHIVFTVFNYEDNNIHHLYTTRSKTIITQSDGVLNNAENHSCFWNRSCNILSSLVSSYFPSISVQTPEWAEADACQKCDMPFFWNMKAMWEKKTMGRRQVLKNFRRLLA